ncbi:MAG TPA: hypothetical protein VF590_08210 [Isosphaeraceae bacterium]
MTGAPPPRVRIGPAAPLVGLAVLELAYVSWFLHEPLPNAANAGATRLTRADLLWEALPGIVPGVRFGRSHLGRALLELRHVGNLPQRLPIVLAAALIAGAAVALGDCALGALGIRRRLHPLERIPLAYGLGTTGLALATLGLGRLGRLSPAPIRLGLGFLIASAVAWEGRGGLRRGDRRDPDDGGPDRPASVLGHRPSALLGLAVLVGPFLVLMALGAMVPTAEYDALEYHLQGPKEYYLAGRIGFLPHNVYTSMPAGVEMLHLLGMVVLGDWWRGALVGQLLIAAFAPATAALVAMAVRRRASGRAAWVAAVAYLTTPWVVRLAVLPFVEGPLGYFEAALLWAMPWGLGPEHGLARDGKEGASAPSVPTPIWLLAGLLAGGAMACKYPALVAAAVPFGLIAGIEALRRRSGRIALAFGVGGAVVIGPWLIKNVADTGNPVYPLAYRVFGGRHWDAARDAKWWEAHRPRAVSTRALADGVAEVAGRSDWQSPLYAALAPLALLRRGSRRFALALWGLVTYLFLTWWLLTHRVDRFWLPLLPAAAALAGLGADWTSHRAWSALLAAILAVGIAANLTLASTPLMTGTLAWTGDLVALRAEIPAQVNPPLARLDAELPPGAKVLLVGQASAFHVRHPVVYNTVFDREILETIAAGRPPAQIRAALAALGVTHVYVDWSEIARHRHPGGYGFTSFVTPELFARLVAAGVLGPPATVGEQQKLYAVRAAPGVP